MTVQLIDHVFAGLSILGIVAFSISGALFAAEKKLDILGFILVGTVTGIGGGTLRDVLLGNLPIHWTANPHSIYLCITAAGLTYFTVGFYHNRQQWILWMDAIGLAVFAVMGAQSALAHQTPELIAVVMGIMTATFGGILRDTLCADVVTLMRPELYITCALTAASVYVLLRTLGLAENIASVCGFLSGFGLRAAAIRYGWILPKFGQ